MPDAAAFHPRPSAPNVSPLAEAPLASIDSEHRAVMNYASGPSLGQPPDRLLLAFPSELKKEPVVMWRSPVRMAELVDAHV
jgi:hypothetical protein